MVRVRGEDDVKPFDSDVETAAYMANLRADIAGEPRPFADRAEVCPTCKGVGDRKASCTKCDGEGYRRCARCHGAGERQCNLGHYHDCDDCDGDGTCVCESCDNAGTCPACDGKGWRVPRIERHAA